MACLYEYLLPFSRIPDTANIFNLDLDFGLANMVEKFSNSDKFYFKKKHDICFNIVSTSATEDISKAHAINILTTHGDKISLFQYDSLFSTVRYYLFFKCENMLYGFSLYDQKAHIYFYHNSIYHMLDLNMPSSVLEKEASDKILHLFKNPPSVNTSTGLIRETVVRTEEPVGDYMNQPVFGPAGPRGPVGATGPRGIDINQGVFGPAGPRGPVGATGPRGIAANQGVSRAPLVASTLGVDSLLGRNILEIMLDYPIEIPFDFPDFGGKIPKMFRQKDYGIVGIQYVDIEPEVV